MKRFLILYAILSLALSTGVQAQKRTLRWDTGGVFYEPDCNNLPAFTKLHSGLIVPKDVMTITGLRAEMDFCSVPNPLEPFWTFDDPEGGRFEALSIDLQMKGAVDKVNWPEGTTWSIEIETGYKEKPFLAHAEILIHAPKSFTIPSDAHVRLFTLLFDNSSMAEGCEQALCLITNSLRVDVPGGEIWSDHDYENWASWGSPFQCPWVVPVEDRTWSSIKLLHP